MAHDEWNTARKCCNQAESSRLHRKKVAIFNKLKTQFINDQIRKSNGNRVELYKFLKFKNRGRNSLPAKMSFNGENIDKSMIPEMMAKHLSSAFAEGDSRVYDGNININIEELWSSNFDENQNQRELSNIELFDIIAAINGAKSTKDPGPMDFPIKIFQLSI